MHVPAEACAGLSDTLRAEVMGENSLKVRMRHGRLPSEFGASTAKARAVGNHMYNIAAGPGQPQPLKPGVWFIRVENTRLSSVSYRICAKLFQDVDKLAYNPALVGCDVGMSTVVEAEGDEWEMVDRLSVTEANPVETRSPCLHTGTPAAHHATKPLAQPSYPSQPDPSPQYPH